MSEENDAYHELERQERMSWRPLAIASVLTLVLGPPVVLFCYFLIERFA